MGCTELQRLYRALEAVQSLRCCTELHRLYRTLEAVQSFRQSFRGCINFRGCIELHRLLCTYRAIRAVQNCIGFIELLRLYRAPEEVHIELQRLYTALEAMESFRSCTVQSYETVQSFTGYLELQKMYIIVEAVLSFRGCHLDSPASLVGVQHHLLSTGCFTFRPSPLTDVVHTSCKLKLVEQIQGAHLLGGGGINQGYSRSAHLRRQLKQKK